MTNGNKGKQTLRPVPNVRQLAINPLSINWTNYSPPVRNIQPIQQTQSLCRAAVVVFFFCTTILMCHHRAADLPDCQESFVSQLHPIRNTKYMFRLLRGCGYRCLCVQPRRAGWRQNATILQKQSLIVCLCRSSEETRVVLFCTGEARGCGAALYTYV